MRAERRALEPQAAGRGCWEVGWKRELGFRDAAPPIARLATAMHDRHDENELRLDGVEHRTETPA